MGTDPLDETDLSGNLTNEYIFLSGKRIARRDSSNNVVYYFADHLGTARIVANSSGSVLDDSDFYPFGGERVITSSSGNRYKFTGKERDSESGLDNFGARYDSPTLGRFMSVDPVNATSTDPQRWNRYTYASNNPLARLDSTGRAWNSWEHDDITRRAFAQARLPVDNQVVTGVRDRDGGGLDGHNPYVAPGIHPLDWRHENYSAETQGNHFLRDTRQSQMEAYRVGVGTLMTDAGSARISLKSGDVAGAKQATEDAIHLIEDSFAHTTRAGGSGAITHIQCFNCSRGNGKDHHHPALYVNGQLSNEGQGSVDAAAAFLTIMQNAAAMSDEQFDQAIINFIKQFLTENLDSQESGGDLSRPPGVGQCPPPACKQ